MDILSTEVIAGLIILSAISMSVRSLTAFSNTLSELRPKLAEVDRRIDHVSDGMEGNQSKLAHLSELVSPLKKQETNLKSYYSQIRKLEFQLEREKLVSEQSKEERKDLNIRRRNLEGI